MFKATQTTKWPDRAVVRRCASCSIFSTAPSSAQTHVNKACDGMSAREVWSRAALRLALFVALPASDTLCHPAKFPAEDFPYPSPLSSSCAHSRLHLLRWNGLLLPRLSSVCYSTILFSAGKGLQQRQMSPHSPKSRKRETTTSVMFSG